MALQTVTREQLLSTIIDSLAAHPAMHGLLAEIPANLPISEEWHQVNTSEANWRISRKAPGNLERTSGLCPHCPSIQFGRVEVQGLSHKNRRLQ